LEHQGVIKYSFSLPFYGHAPTDVIANVLARPVLLVLADSPEFPRASHRIQMDF